MKNTHFFLLVGITAISAIIATVMLLRTPERFSPNNEQIGEYLVKSFSQDDVKEIRIKDSENEVVLKQDGSDWVVANRQDYPIDNPAEVQQLLRSLQQFKIGLEVPAEPEHFAQIGLLAPEQKEEAEAYQEELKKTGESNPKDPRGLHISVTGTGGENLANLILGEPFGEIASRAPRGFVTRNLASSSEEPEIWKALGTLNQTTGDAESKNTDKRRGPFANPASWLSYKFIEVNKIRSISLSAPNDEDFKGWTVTRDDENGDFSTGDLKEDEEMDSASTGAFKTLFSTLRFEDVLDPAEGEKQKDPAQARKAVITTFDGFTYTFDYAPMKEKETESDNDAPPPPSANYIGTVKVEANLPAEREKKEDETPEDAENAEKLFQANLDNLKYKLELEKVFASRLYEFANFAISSLNKGRDEIVKKKEEDAENNADANGAGAPPRPTAVSPPVAIPPRPSATTPPIPVPSPPDPPEDNSDSE